MWYLNISTHDLCTLTYFVVERSFKIRQRQTVNHRENYYQKYGTNNINNDGSEEEGYLLGLEIEENSQANVNTVKSKQP